MKIKEIYNFLDQVSAFGSQEKWDNSGLILGNMEDEFHEVYISVDVDIEFLESVNNDSLIITHHPLIFSGLKTLNFDSYTTKLLQIMIKKDIKLISMHTNIDKSHLNHYVMNQLLGFQTRCENEFILSSKVDMNFDDFYQLVQKKLGLGFKKVVKCHQNIRSFSLVTGSGMSFLPSVTTDVFLTGDIKYHDAMEAKLRNISLIDIGHFESEVHFGTLIYAILEKYLKKNKIQAIIGQNQNPFEYQ